MNDKRSKPAESKKSTKKPFEKLSGQEKQKVKDKRVENMNKKAKPNSQKAKTGKKRKKIYDWLRDIVILVLIMSSIPFLVRLRERLRTEAYFGDQPIMRTDLLDLELKYQSFSFSNSSNSLMGKPSKSSITNCFYKPDNISNVDIIKKVIEKAEGLDWKFNLEKLWIRDNGDVSITSEDRSGFSVWARVTQPSENIKMDKTEICVSIGDTNPR